MLLDDQMRLDVSSFVSDYDEEFFGSGGLARLRQRLMNGDVSARHRISPQERLGSPIRRPSKIVCVGLNYRDHAAESGIQLPSEPVLFFKATSALVGPNDALVIPRGAEKVDWEVELAVIIEKEAKYVPKEQASEFIAGYALHNDYSERSFQLERGGQWMKGKSADTFAPLGPFLATRDEVPKPDQLGMWLTVNGEFRQKSNTAEMVFDVPTLVSYVSEFMTLLPGDIISTGTPAGVALGMRPPTYLRPGDVVALGIDGLGTSRQEVTAWKNRS